MTAQTVAITNRPTNVTSEYSIVLLCEPLAAIASTPEPLGYKDTISPIHTVKMPFSGQNQSCSMRTNRRGVNKKHLKTPFVSEAFALHDRVANVA